MGKIQELISLEEKRQEEAITLIPSENYTSKAVREALASKLVNKYSEGYSGKRYYQGNSVVDEIETLAVEKAKELFKVPHANVQPYSGSPANTAVLMGLLEKGDKIMGMSLSAGGHLTHGHPNITFSGKYFDSVQYGVNGEGLINYDEVEKLANIHKPKLIIAGTTAYSRIIDWERFSQIAEKVGAILLADISHIAGLIVGEIYPSPVNYVDVVTTTTHKTLRGPRGAMIVVTDKGLKKDPDMSKKIDRAVFPGLQGGPHDNQTAAIAIALTEAAEPSFKEYAGKVVTNAKVLSEELTSLGFKIVSGGTDSHLMLVDLTESGISGKEAAIKLEEAGIVVNYNTIPNDPNPPSDPSGIRIGTPAATTRGMGEVEMKTIAGFIHQILTKKVDPQEILSEVKNLTTKYPCP